MIKFCSTQSVIDFVNFANQFVSNITVYDGHIEIDAKSMMGMMNIPINKLLKVEINAIDDVENDKFVKELNKYAFGN